MASNNSSYLLRWKWAGENRNAAPSHQQSQHGDSEDIQTLSTLATYAAIALENARLHCSHLCHKDLSALNNYNEDIVESVAGGLIVLDRSLKVLTWNTGMEQISRSSATKLSEGICLICSPTVRTANSENG